jgi:hypothetical protein
LEEEELVLSRRGGSQMVRRRISRAKGMLSQEQESKKG